MPGGRRGRGKAPAAPPTPRKPAVDWTKDGSAFLWLVAEQGIAAAGSKQPAVLLIGERSTQGKSTVNGSRGRHWNVPGGGAKKEDKGDPKATALREFVEETKGNLEKLLKTIASVQIIPTYISRSGKTHYYIVKVNATAEMISAVLGLAASGKDRKTQTNAVLSGETQGWVWVTKQALAAAGATPASHPIVNIGQGFAVQLRNSKTARPVIVGKM